MNLYVSNLAFSLSEDDLRDIFTPFGEVASAKIISDRGSGRSRGFGFVEMNVDAEANAARVGIHDQEVGGRAVSVFVAREKTPRSQRGLY